VDCWGGKEYEVDFSVCFLIVMAVSYGRVFWNGGSAANIFDYLNICIYPFVEDCLCSVFHAS